MHAVEALLLGVVQGLTEFLPISSSGHLILVPWLQDYQYLHHHPHFNKTFDVALHLGTLVGVVFYFRREIVALTRGFLSAVAHRRARSVSERVAVSIAIATVPAALARAALQDTIDEHLGDPWQIARLLGLERDSAARFSFLLLAPVTAGAVLVKGLGVAKDGLPHGAAGPTLVGV